VLRIGGVPVIRASTALALALVATLAPSVARADPPAAEPPESAEPPPAQEPRHYDRTFRLALFADQRKFSDLTALGGGAALSVGRASDRIAGQFELRAGAGRTSGGLSTLELGVGASGEYRVAGGFFLGAGAGAALFGVQRATDGSELLTIGPEAYGRAGYRFGKLAAPFVVFDYGAQLHVGFRNDLLTGLVDGTWVWGPTVSVGYTF
jgi:hypothetical protein